MHLSIVMPCLNEAETLEQCIQKAWEGIQLSGIEGEVIVADNGSDDGSQQIAIRAGARVVSVREQGYGNALHAGIVAAAGKWVLMADADDSYDFRRAPAFIQPLLQGYDLVMGCRMPRGGGRIMPHAMPWKHRWIGNPILTAIGRLFFKCPVHDFHCGMRAFRKDSYLALTLRTTGMEFASEMVIKATLAGHRITEVPVTLYPDGRSRAPHLRSWRDGWRHLRFMLLFSPRWLFMFPGIAAASLGLLGLVSLCAKSVIFGKVVLDVGTMMVSSMAWLIGLQLLWFAVFTRTVAVSGGLLPPNRRLESLLKTYTLEWGVLLGIGMCLAGGGWLLTAFLGWHQAGFRGLDYGLNLRRIIPATTLIVTGIQFLFGSFFIGVLGLKTVSNRWLDDSPT